MRKVVRNEQEQLAWKERKKANRRARYYSDKSSERASNRVWKAANPEKVKAYKATDYARHKEAIRERHKAWCAANSDRLKAGRKEWYKNNKELSISKHKAWREKVKAANGDPLFFSNIEKANRKIHRAKYILRGIKGTCKRKNLACDLTIEWIDARLKSGVCEMTGLPFDMTLDGHKRRPNAPSVDRIKPDGDYTQDNCRIVLWFINRAMLNFGEDYAFDVFSRAIERSRRRVPTAGLLSLVA